MKLTDEERATHPVPPKDHLDDFPDSRDGRGTLATPFVPLPQTDDVPRARQASAVSVVAVPARWRHERAAHGRLGVSPVRLSSAPVLARESATAVCRPPLDRADDRVSLR